MKKEDFIKKYSCHSARAQNISLLGLHNFFKEIARWLEFFSDLRHHPLEVAYKRQWGNMKVILSRNNITSVVIVMLYCEKWFKFDVEVI